MKTERASLYRLRDDSNPPAAACCEAVRVAGGPTRGACLVSSSDQSSAESRSTVGRGPRRGLWRMPPARRRTQWPSASSRCVGDMRLRVPIRSCPRNAGRTTRDTRHRAFVARPRRRQRVGEGSLTQTLQHVTGGKPLLNQPGVGGALGPPNWWELTPRAGRPDRNGEFRMRTEASGSDSRDTPVGVRSSCRPRRVLWLARTRSNPSRSLRETPARRTYGVIGLRR